MLILTDLSQLYWPDSRSTNKLAGKCLDAGGNIETRRRASLSEGLGPREVLCLRPHYRGCACCRALLRGTRAQRVRPILTSLTETALVPSRKRPNTPHGIHEMESCEGANTQHSERDNHQFVINKTKRYHEQVNYLHFLYMQRETRKRGV